LDDIDGPGLEFLSDLRGHGIPARTILTDTATLDAFRHLAIAGTAPARRELPTSNPENMTFTPDWPPTRLPPVPASCWNRSAYRGTTPTDISPQPSAAAATA
jgi:hypothetical protein